MDVLSQEITVAGIHDVRQSLRVETNRIMTNGEAFVMYGKFGRWLPACPSVRSGDEAGRVGEGKVG